MPTIRAYRHRNGYIARVTYTKPDGEKVRYYVGGETEATREAAIQKAKAYLVRFPDEN